MKVSVDKKGPCRKVMTVELPVERVQEEYNQVLKHSAKLARIPGFRQGRAPIGLVESHYGREIRADVQERLVARSYKEALKKAEIDPVMLLNLDADLQKDRPLVYRLTVDVAPDFKLPRYKGISLKAMPLEVTDAMVESSLQRLLENYAKYEDAGDQPVRPNDLAMVDFDAQMDGQPLSAIGRAAAGLDQGRDMMVMVNEQGAFLPGFDKELVGLKKGDEKRFEVTFPPSFRAQGLAGKTASYHVRIKNVRARQPAALDAELLKQLEAADEAQLRSQIREKLLAELQRQDRERLKEDIVQHLLAKTSLELPESLAQEETARVFSSLARRALMQGMTRDQLAARRDELRKTAETTAADRIKMGYILHRIAGEEQIKVEDAEVDREIQTLAPRYRMTEEQLRKQLQDDQEIDALRHDILARKALDFLLANAKIGEEGFLSRLMGGGRKPAAEETPAAAP